MPSFCVSRKTYCMPSCTKLETSQTLRTHPRQWNPARNTYNIPGPIITVVNFAVQGIKNIMFVWNKALKIQMHVCTSHIGSKHPDYNIETQTNSDPFIYFFAHNVSKWKAYHLCFSITKPTSSSSIPSSQPIQLIVTCLKHQVDKNSTVVEKKSLS